LARWCSARPPPSSWDPRAGVGVGPRDGLVLASYLTAIFLLALTAIAFLAIGAAIIVVGRGAKASTA